MGGAKHLAVNDAVYHAAARLMRGNIAAHAAVKGQHTAIDGKCRRRVLSGKRLGVHDRVLLDLHGGIVRFRRQRRLQGRRFAPKMHAAADKHDGKHRRSTDKRRHASPRKRHRRRFRLRQAIQKRRGLLFSHRFRGFYKTTVVHSVSSLSCSSSFRRLRAARTRVWTVPMGSSKPSASSR